MRILHVVPSYIPAWRYGGTIQSVHGLCKSLAKLGHETHVFTTNVNGPDDSEVPLMALVNIDGVKVWYFPSRHFRRLYWSPLMKRALKERLRSFDLVHLHSIFLWPTWAAARIAEKAKIPYVVSPRGMLVKNLIYRKNRFVKSLCIKLIEKHTLEAAAGIHMTSELEMQEALNFGFRFPFEFVIPNGYDYEMGADKSAEYTSSVEHAAKNTPFILFIGRINWKKGLDRLIPALTYVPETHLIIAGNDEENYRPALERLAKDSGVDKRISFMGAVYGKDKKLLFSRASLFVLPSYSENFGNTVLEAMASGCPVVVTSDVGFSEIVQKTGAGLVVDGHPRILGESIRNLLDQPETLQRMAKIGQEFVTERFKWDAIAQNMEAQYKRILGNCAGC